MSQPSEFTKKIAPLGPLSNAANLLPTGTVLAFEALISSFSNNGSCTTANKVLTGLMIAACLATCYFFSFTDSFTKDKKLYYVFARWNGEIFVFNRNKYMNSSNSNQRERTESELARMLKKRFQRSGRDYVHAVAAMVVFLAFAFGNSEVQSCFFPSVGANGTELLKNLPLGAGVVGSFLFTLFPTTRRGFGYADMTTSSTSEEKNVENEMLTTTISTQQPSNSQDNVSEN